MAKKRANRYVEIIERIFRNHYKRGKTQFEFERDELQQVAATLGVAVPKNVGDILYAFRFRASFPDSVVATAPQGSRMDDSTRRARAIPI